jgi:hypothetical protein
MGRRRIVSSLRDVCKMNACSAHRVYPSARMFLLQNRWTNFDKIWYGCYAIGSHPKICSNSMDDAQNREMGATLAPHNAWSFYYYYKYYYYYVGVRLCLWGTGPLTGPLSIPQMKNEQIWSSGGMTFTEENQRTRRKICPSATCPPLILHGLPWGRIRASAVRGQRLTTWAMAWPWNYVCNLHEIYDIYDMLKIY